MGVNIVYIVFSQAELELLMSDDEDTRKHFNLKELIQDEKQLKGKKKRKMRKLKEKIAQRKAAKEQEDDFQVCYLWVWVALCMYAPRHTHTHTHMHLYLVSADIQRNTYILVYVT